MKQFINDIQEHKWVDLCEWVFKNTKGSLCGYGEYAEWYNTLGGSTQHLRAEEISSGALFEIRLLCTDRKATNYKVIALVNIEGNEYIEEFNCDGNSKDGLMKLHYEAIFFDPGDYVVTTQGAIGIYANHWYMFASLEKDGTEHLDLFGCGIYKRPANEEEIKKLDEMLWVNNKKWNNETKQLEDI